MPKDQTNNTPAKFASSHPYADPSGSRRVGKNAQDDGITNETAQRGAGKPVEQMAPAPFEEELIAQPPFIRPDIAHSKQSLFENAHQFRMRDFNHTITVNAPNFDLVDGM
jgi:hypothetical protein